MRFLALISLGVCGLASLSGCKIVEDLLAEPVKRATEAQVTEATASLRKELAALTAKLSDQQKSADRLQTALETSLADLKREVEWNEVVRGFSENQYKRESASVTSDSNGYAPSRSPCRSG